MLTREDIKSIFEDTRPRKNYYRPPDNVPTCKNFYDYLEFDYLHYFRMTVEAYARANGLSDFSIEMRRSEDIESYYENKTVVPVCKAVTPAQKKLFPQERLIIFKAQDEPWGERISVAQAVGELVLKIIPDLLGKPSPLNLPSSTTPNYRKVATAFFVEQFLLLLAKHKLASVLPYGPKKARELSYVLTEDEIIKNIKTRYPCYEKGYPSLGNAHKNALEQLLNNYFQEIPKNNPAEAMLNSDTRLIQAYIRYKADVMGVRNHGDMGIEMIVNPQNLGIKATRNQFLDKPHGRLKYSMNKNLPGCYIHYPPLYTIRYTMKNLNNWLIMRLIVAHELGHAACHVIPGVYFDSTNPSTATPIFEQEATYFARLLLERRELLYNNMDETAESYINECKNIKLHIRGLYSHYGEGWLDWVLADHARVPSYP